MKQICPSIISLTQTKTEIVVGLTCISPCSLCGIVLCCLLQSFAAKHLFADGLDSQ